MNKLTKKQIINNIEIFVKQEMSGLPGGDVHGWEHVDRVRKWALKIGRGEGGVDMFILEVTALLHDIGYKPGDNAMSHYRAGKIKAEKLLKKYNYFSNKEIEAVCTSIFEHGRGGKSKLTKILQDADRMDLWGAIGIARTIKDHPELPVYIDKESFKVKLWSQEEINNIYANFHILGSYLDKCNLCLSIYQYVNTKTAKRLAEEKIKYMKAFIRQLKKETIDL